MKVSKSMTLQLTTDEAEALAVTYDLMEELQKEFPEIIVKYLESSTTGEIVEPHEFGRAKGIIDFIANSPFRVKRKTHEDWSNTSHKKIYITPDEITGVLGQILDEIDLPEDIRINTEALYNKAYSILSER